ncbi:nuclear receptor subfamily 5, group A, member 5 isoform X1 [Oncorhynchus kisutch]|uniref:nuclear receptor subfamily 5, group A, member 5 isoform X1 n=1 Tax=Oncorhynchus kisutch TaxID=8019 RepID=UPI0012DCCED8|nr:nuclear receptor subfamily 5 group A member 2 isoform X1 [Oncorhynchus kisutch]
MYVPQGHFHAGQAQPLDMLSSEGSSTSQELKTEPGTRPDQAEVCPVCGDKVSGYHYGLLTCESCKGFFKRSVQNNKRYTCAERQSCPMNPSQRKRCPYCRFQKCLAVGMKREAVRADRMRGGRNKFGPLYRRDRQMKQQRGVYRHQQHNTTPYRIKLESAQTHQPSVSNNIHLMSSHTSAPLPSDNFHQSQAYPSNLGLSELHPMLLDCTLNRDRKALAPPPSLAYPEVYHRSSHGGGSGYHQEKSEMMPYSYGPAPPTPPRPKGLLTTPTTTPSSTPTPTLTSMLTAPIPSFLAQLLEGEPDERQLCAKVLASLQREQASRGKHDRLNTFSIMCKMADQTLFGLVEWARNSALFKELKVEDQMVLLQSCWSELLVLDHLCRQVAYSREGCIYLVTGQQIEVSNILTQAGVTLTSLVSRTQDLVVKLKALHLDTQEFVCLKYLVLFNPDVKSVQDRGQVEQTQERVNHTLMDHTLYTHPGHTDKFGQLLLRLPEVRSISLQVEEYLYQRHLQDEIHFSKAGPNDPNANPNHNH